MISLSDRSSTFTDSVIRRMSRVCARHGALNLAQGFPDYNPPEQMLRRLAEVAWQGPHQYATTWGAQNVREAICEKMKHFSGVEYDPASEVAVTCGGTEAMMACVLATMNPGDKIAIFSPFYENYGADAILSGAEPIFVPLKPPSFTFDEEALRAAFRAGAKALILCNPSNPSGKVFSREELLSIAKIVEEFNVFVITDEVYEHIIYKPAVHTHFSALPGMRERTLVCNSLSKTYSITGWRLGYVLGPEEALDRVRKVHDFLTVGAAAPLQEAAVTGLKFGDDYYEQLQAEYTHRRDLFLSGLDSIGLTYFRPQGTYFVLVDISRFGYDDDYQFCLDLAEKVKIGAVPGSSFFREPENRYIRLHFAKGEDSVLEDAIERLSHVNILQK